MSCKDVMVHSKHLKIRRSGWFVGLWTTRNVWAARAIVRIVVLLLLVGCKSQAAQNIQTTDAGSMKGFELYSWSEGDAWRYSLLEGTNRIKSYSEVTAADIQLDNIEALIEAMGNLPLGDWVFWSDQRVPGTHLPPQAIVDTIRGYSQQIGLQLDIE